MPYSKTVSRTHPTAIIFLVDQSSSMADNYGADLQQTKAKLVADTLNRQLMELVIRSTKGDGVRHYFDIAVIGYGRSVGPVLGGNLAGRDFLPISDIADFPLRVEEATEQDANGEEETVRYPIWMEPVSNGSTPMMQAFSSAITLVQQHIALHPDSFPPIVINITDGEATDGDPRPLATQLRDLQTSDGNVLVYNAHISASQEKAVILPDSAVGLPDVYAEALYAMSSALPHVGLVRAAQLGHTTTDLSRGFIFNAPSELLVHLVDIGTSTQVAR
ncbi:vWA domain-containing protein [Deinococcus marmoris]|uniref:vWA domain-containing protein n=1 Tax=Deinococcus marmoris TaxID=249408 RepID=UPI00049845AF|nr:vWA domain-containing protein [Deinococcus marmoris]